jgi:hypothetical protein
MLSFLITKAEEGILARGHFTSAFPVMGDNFTKECCGAYAELLRRHSRLAEVRATPKVTLESQIRTDVFARADDILRECEASYSEWQRALNGPIPPPAPGLVTSVLQGAAAGQMAAGLGKHGKLLGAIGAFAAAGEHWDRTTARLSNQLSQSKATDMAKITADDKIGEYLGAIPSLCENLFDYGCAKCLGAEVNFDAQRNAFEKFIEFLKVRQEQLDSALLVGAEKVARDLKENEGNPELEELKGDLDLAKTAEMVADTEEERRSARSEQERLRAAIATSAAAASQQHPQSVESSKRSSPGCGGCLVAAGGMTLFASVAVILDATTTSSTEPLVWFGIGATLLTAGIFILVDARSRKHAAAETVEKPSPGDK